MTGLLSLVVFFGLWEIAARTGMVAALLLPAPSQIATRFWSLLTEPVYGSSFYEQFGVSLRRVVTGFLLGSTLGIALGAMMGWSRRVEAAVDPLFELFRPIPPIAWIPLAILWLGIGEAPKIFLICIGSFIPCVINAYTGVRTTDPVLIRAAKSLGAKDRRIFLEVALPSSVPVVVAGLRVALGNSWAILIAAELVAAQSGLGYMMNTARQYLDTDVVIIGMLIIGVTGWTMDFVLRALERRIPWHAR